MAVKEYVRQHIFNEMEPMKVQVAMLQKQLNEVVEKSTEVVPVRSNSEPNRSIEEKAQDISPRVENWMYVSENRIGETNARVGKVENVLRELGALHDKFTQRHDSLVECVQDLDQRVDHVKTALETKPRMNMDVQTNGLLSVPEGHHQGLALPSIPPGGWVPPHGSRNFGSGPQHGNATFLALEHEASLEVEELSFTVERRSGAPLGMILRNDSSTLVVDKITESCTMPVMMGDRIIAVDGVHGDSKTLLELMRRIGNFSITIHRLLSTTL